MPVYIVENSNTSESIQQSVDELSTG